VKVQATFGFVTGCHVGDKFMVQATLASMRHYCPNVPICLTVDDDFDVSDLEDDYKVIILRVGDLPSAEMRKLIAGGFHASMRRCGKGHLSFTSGSTPTRFFRAILPRKSAPTLISKFFGARSRSRPTPQKFRLGCCIFILTRASCGSLIPISIGAGILTLALECSRAAVMRYRLNSISISRQSVAGVQACSSPA